MAKKQMNIQIFGAKKCNNTKKAERFFKERGFKYQFIDIIEMESSLHWDFSLIYGRDGNKRGYLL